MPGGDRTGPGGAGPMTGRAAGYCAGYAAAPGYANPIRGYGRGRDEAGAEVEEEDLVEVGMRTHRPQLFHQLTHKTMCR